jgi:hypothetical protein
MLPISSHVVVTVAVVEDGYGAVRFVQLTLGSCTIRPTPEIVSDSADPWVCLRLAWPSDVLASHQGSTLGRGGDYPVGSTKVHPCFGGRLWLFWVLLFAMTHGPRGLGVLTLTHVVFGKIQPLTHSSTIWIHTMFVVVFAKVLYSALVLDLDTVACFLALWDMRLGPKNTANRSSLGHGCDKPIRHVSTCWLVAYHSS